MNLKFKNRKGMSILVELVFVAPLIIGLMFAIIFGGIMMNQYIAINNAAREGVRELCIEASNPQMDAWDDAFDIMHDMLKGTAIDYNKFKNGVKFERTARWENGSYVPDNTEITSGNIEVLNFHDKVQISIDYPTTFDTIFLGTYHPVLHAKSEYLVEYMP